MVLHGWPHYWTGHRSDWHYLESWISDDTQTHLDEGVEYTEPLNGTAIISYKNTCSQLNLSDVEENPSFLKERRVWVDGIIFRKYEFESINRTVTLGTQRIPRARLRAC